jgi:hypothetical protein
MRRGRWKTVCARGADQAPSVGRSASPLDGSMVSTLWIPSRKYLACVPTVALLAGCRCFFGEQQGLFYFIQLREPPADTVCLEFAHSLATRLQLQVTTPSGSLRSKNQCFEVLSKTSRMTVSIISWPQQNRLGIAINNYRFNSPIAPSRESTDLAPRLVQAAHEYFPGADITPAHPCNDLLGP